ncbi:hypothetical protein BDV12DRAFT_202169 [Aspergillus spectabilis]
MTDKLAARNATGNSIQGEQSELDRLDDGPLDSILNKERPTSRMFRKMVHGLLNAVTSRNYFPYQMLENKQMLYEFFTQPEDFLKHIRRYSNTLTTTIVVDLLFGVNGPPSRDACCPMIALPRSSTPI